MRTAGRSRLAARLTRGLALGLLACLAAMGQPTPAARAQSGANQAGIVVRHGDGRVVTACVTFDEPQLSGIQLLQRSGLDLNVEASSTGAGVCRLDGEGCSVPQQSCFCQCTGATCNYWSYWQLSTDGWQYSNFGASGSEIKPGQVDGWAWGDGSMDSTNGKPPALTFADVCTASTPTGTPTAGPATPTSASTSTPTSTPTGTPTPFPTTAPLGSPPRIELFAADATQLAPGQVARLHWRVVDAASVMLVAGGQRVPVDAEGTTALAPGGDVEVRLEATNSSGAAAESVQLRVSAPTAEAVVQAQASPPVAPASTPVPTVVPTPMLPNAPIAALAPAAAAAPPAPTPNVTARLLLPLVMRATAQPISDVVRRSATAGGNKLAVAAVVVPLAPVPSAAIATAAPAPVAAAILPTAAVGVPAAVGGPAAAAEPERLTQQAARSQPPGVLSLVWVALAALLVLPAGIGTLGYLAWRLVSRR